MQRLPKDILLLIVDNLDWTSILRYRRVNKYLYQLLKNYERYIVDTLPWRLTVHCSSNYDYSNMTIKRIWLSFGDWTSKLIKRDRVWTCGLCDWEWCDNCILCSRVTTLFKTGHGISSLSSLLDVSRLTSGHFPHKVLYMDRLFNLEDINNINWATRFINIFFLDYHLPKFIFYKKLMLNKTMSFVDKDDYVQSCIVNGELSDNAQKSQYQIDEEELGDYDLSRYRDGIYIDSEEDEW